MSRLALLLATIGVASSADAATQMPSRPISAAILVPDSGRSSALPDFSSWRPVLEGRPGAQAALRLEWRDSAGAQLWLDTLEVWLIWKGADLETGDMIDREQQLSPGRLRLRCLSGCDGAGESMFTSHVYLGVLPPVADVIRVELRRPVPEDAMVQVLWSRRIERFVLGASIGGTLPLNRDGDDDLARRAALHGRVLVSRIPGFSSPGCRFRQRTPALAALAALPMLVNCLVHFSSPHARWFAGPFLLEGEFLLGLAQVDSSASSAAGSFAESSEGYTRIEFPLLDFRDNVSLRAFGQGGFITVRGSSEFFLQKFYGLRLGLDATDYSGRQSFIEFALGKSENLRPSGPRRRRVTAQLRAPATPLVFQIVVNYKKRGVPNVDNPVVLSAFLPFEFQSLYNALTGRPAR